MLLTENTHILLFTVLLLARHALVFSWNKHCMCASTITLCLHSHFKKAYMFSLDAPCNIYLRAGWLVLRQTSTVALTVGHSLASPKNFSLCPSQKFIQHWLVRTNLHNYFKFYYFIIKITMSNSYAFIFSFLSQPKLVLTCSNWTSSYQFPTKTDELYGLKDIFIASEANRIKSYTKLL